MLSRVLNYITLGLFLLSIVLLVFDFRGSFGPYDNIVAVVKFMLLVSLNKLLSYLILTTVTIPATINAFQKETEKMLLGIKEEQ